MEPKNWPVTLPEREAFIMSAIVEGEAAIDRLSQMVGTDDFTGLAAEAMSAFEAATRNGEPEPDEWERVVELAERYQSSWPSRNTQSQRRGVARTDGGGGVQDRGARGRGAWCEVFY